MGCGLIKIPPSRSRTSRGCWLAWDQCLIFPKRSWRPFRADAPNINLRESSGNARTPFGPALRKTAKSVVRASKKQYVLLDSGSIFVPFEGPSVPRMHEKAIEFSALSHRKDVVPEMFISFPDQFLMHFIAISGDRGISQLNKSK